MGLSQIESWMWSFLGIIIEALPFLLIGAVVSALIQLYLSEEFIKRVMQGKHVLAYLIAAVAGIFFPVCECAIVPVARSLIKKGLPVGVGITFMLAVPIVNPVVIMSTYYAFPNNFNIVIWRTVGGIVTALAVGIIIGHLYSKKRPDVYLKEEDNTSFCDCCSFSNNYYSSIRGKAKSLLLNASSEFLNISIYFILGALISSIFIVFFKEGFVSNIAGGNIVGIIAMMSLGFLLSLCSEADAFVARGFFDNFGTAGVVAFLILGPMMDLKNLILALGFFKKEFVFKLLFIISAIVFAVSLVILI